MAKVIETKNKRLADCCQRCGWSKDCGLQFSVECVPQGVIMPGNWICDDFGIEPIKVPTCRECECTDNDCRQCIEATGQPCHWVEPDLCSRCADEIIAAADVAAEVHEPLVPGPEGARL